MRHSHILRALVFLVALHGSERAEAQAAAMPEGWIEIAPAKWDSKLGECLNWARESWRVSLSHSADRIVVSRSSGDLGTDSLPVDGGILLGWNMGEFGGGVAFQPHLGKPDTLVRENLRAFVRSASGIRAVVGLAHLRVDRGAVYLLEALAEGSWRASRVADLRSAPRAVLPLGGDSLLILATRRLVVLSPTNAVRELVTSDNWWPLYANSIVRDPDGHIVIGMRGAIARLSPIEDGYRERWYLPSPCKGER